MEKPRIVLVVRRAEGGIVTHVKQLLDALNQEYYTAVACPPETAGHFAGLAGEALPVSLRDTFHPATDARAVKMLYSYMAAKKASLVHAHGFKAGLVARPAARLARVPCLVTVHGDFVEAGKCKAGKVYYLAERMLSRLTARYIAVSNWLAESLVETCGISRDKITVIPNGIDLAALANNRPPGEREWLVGTVARLAPQKGVDFFLRASAILAAEFPDLRFLVVGDGPLMSQLKELARQLGISERVVFTGQRDNVPALLGKLSVYVQPSLSEGQGLAVLEAMAAGCPVVATRAGGLKEVVVHGENGLLATPGDSRELAFFVAQLLRNPGLAARLGERAKLSLGRYSRDKMLADTLHLYRSVVKGGMPR